MTRESLPLAFAAGALTAAVVTAYAYKKRIDNSLTEIMITLPKWLKQVYKDNKDKEYTSDEDMIMLAVEIASKNVTQCNGGPFGCAIFERDLKTGISKLFTVGANRVVPLTNATLHAEMVAIQFAQKKVKHFTLKGAVEGKEFVLCTSCEPCCMCLGGTMWSGVSELICSATKDDAERIGFIEGPVFPESYKQLEEELGIKVKRSVKREAGAAVLAQYGKTGVIYNG